jgi:hypothetical protein
MKAPFRRNSIRVAAVCVLLIIGARADAATFTDYRDRLNQAATTIEQLEAPDYFSDGQTERDKLIEQRLAYIKKLLPLKETVTFNGQQIEVDNNWLHLSLSEYEKYRYYPDRATAIIVGIEQRLRSLARRLDEIKQSSETSDKDANKARLAEILRRPEFDKSAAQESAIERLWNQLMRWLSKLFPRMKPLQPGTSRSVSSIAQLVVLGISVALIGFLVWKFAPRLLRNRGKKKKKKREARVVLGERLEPDQTSADLLEQAEALARAGDLRGAIRKAYIALLCELGDRKIISLAQHKTNRDYLASVRDKRSLYETMRGLTTSFERHWYGFVPAAADDWSEFRLSCRKAVGSVMGNR